MSPNEQYILSAGFLKDIVNNVFYNPRIDKIVSLEEVIHMNPTALRSKIDQWFREYKPFN